MLALSHCFLSFFSWFHVSKCADFEKYTNLLKHISYTLYYKISQILDLAPRFANNEISLVGCCHIQCLARHLPQNRFLFLIAPQILSTACSGLASL